MTDEYVDPNNDMQRIEHGPCEGNPWEHLAIALEDQLTFYKRNGRMNVRILDRIIQIRKDLVEWEGLRGTDENDIEAMQLARKVERANYRTFVGEFRALAADIEENGGKRKAVALAITDECNNFELAMEKTLNASYADLAPLKEEADESYEEEQRQLVEDFGLELKVVGDGG